MSILDVVSTKSLVATSILLVVGYLYKKLHFQRFVQNAHIPSLPGSLVFGHMIVFDKFTKRGHADRHIDQILYDMHGELGRPPVMLINNWPIVPPMVVVANHAVAEQISKVSANFPYSLHKSPSVERLDTILGPSSIFFKHDEEWKAVRKRFTAGFAPQYLLTLLPVILEKTDKFLNILDNLSQSGDEFSLVNHTTNLTFDIIGAVGMGEDMKAQTLDPSQQGSVTAWFTELARTFFDDKLAPPWWMVPRLHMKRRSLSRRIDNSLEPIIQRCFDNIEAEDARSILALSLRDIDTLTPQLLKETCDQIKTFLFAGHDSTSTLLSTATYELARTPHALQAVRDEVESVFGEDSARDPAKLRDKLLSPGGELLLNQLPYISAVIRETLRLYPPAGSVREARPGVGMVVNTPQGEYLLDGNWVYLNHYLIHRDPEVYGETAHDWIPERWLKRDDALPASTWRPFERGPRNCIGLELANIEAKVVLAQLAHGYQFTKVGLGETALDDAGKPTLDEHGQYLTKSKMYMTFQISAKPVDMMMMKVARNE